MYAGHGLESLRQAKAELSDRFFARQRDAFAERYEAGLFDVSYVAPGTELGMPEPKNMYGLTHNMTSQLLEDGRVEVRQTYLPWEEYPHHYAMCDELNWINRRLHDLEQVRFR